MKETIIQFGTGNFLRGFICEFINTLNKKGLYDGKIVIVQPTKNGKIELLNQQNGKYNLILRGIENGVPVCRQTEINSVTRGVNPYSNYEGYLQLAENPDIRFIVSNTTEAGIEFDENCSFEDKPALSFPGKLTQLLYHRFKCNLNGFIILPCELIDNNGDALKNCVLRYAELWNLEKEFIDWLNTENKFCNTLVDRIVTGFPKDDAELIETYKSDLLLNTAELYHLWVIEGNFENELPLKKTGLNIIWTKDVSSYKKMKVRILNGAHTSLVFPSLLCGVETVKESMSDEQLRKYLELCVFKYILPTVHDTTTNRDFANAVLERFENPYIKHFWKAISLNSVSKFAVRVLPTVSEYIYTENTLPKPLVFSLACLIEFYKNNSPDDAPQAVDFIKNHNVSEVLSNTEFWGKDLSNLGDTVNESIERIHNCGIREALEWAIM